MSTRIRLVAQDPHVDTIEYGWDKTNDSAWKRQTVTRSSVDSNALTWQSIWFANPELYPYFEEVMIDDSPERPHAPYKGLALRVKHMHRHYWGKHPKKKSKKTLRPEAKKHMRDYSRGVQFNNCLHTMQANRFYAPLLPVRTLNVCYTNAYIRSLASSIVTNALNVCVVPDIDMDAYADQALAFMQPRLDEGNSLVNFVLELKDLKHMNPTASVKRIFQRRLPLRALANKKRRKEFQKELISRLNGATLNASFGITPFVGDVVNMYDELVSLSSKIALLKLYEGKVITRHYKRVIPDSNGVRPTHDWSEDVFQSPFYTDWDSTLVHDCGTSSGKRTPITASWRARWVTFPTYHATWRYIYTLDHMSDLDEQIATHLDTLGVRLDPGIVWDAVPFSFVVDWVVDVSSFLHSFARNNYPIRVSDGGFVHSYKYAYEASAIAWIYDLSDGLATPLASHGAGATDTVFTNSKYPPVGPAPIYNGVRSYYNRVKASPSISTVATHAPKLRQLALSGSLLISRVKGWNTNKYHFRPR